MNFKNFLKKLRNKFNPGMISYGILKPCRRCVYAKHYEPILIFSMHRGPRIIVNYNGKTYVRKGDCLGFQVCGQCFRKVSGKSLELPCDWQEF
jgi:hypothetical protein